MRLYLMIYNGIIIYVQLNQEGENLMVAIRESAMKQLEMVPEEKLQRVIDYMRFVCELPPPYEITTKTEFYM